MEIRDDEEKLLRSVALQNANSILLARQRAEEELIRAKEALEIKTKELAYSLSMMRATLESTTDGILVTNEQGEVADFNQKFARMWQIPAEIMEMKEQVNLREFVSTHFADAEGYLDRIRDINTSCPEESLDILKLADGRTIERFSKIRTVNGRNVGRVWSFRDITERIQAEESLRDETRVLELLNATGRTLSSQLDLHAVVQAVTDAGTELSGARFGAFFYNTTDENGDSFMLYTLSGAPREAFDKFGHPRSTRLFGSTFRGEEPIRCDDVLKDERYGSMGPHHGMPPGHLPVRSYLAVPVVARSGQVIGGLFFGHPEPGVFTERAERIIVGVAAQAAIAIDNARLYEAAQKAAEERRILLDNERFARAEVERSSAMKDEFLATLSHELRTPLSAILGWSQLLRYGAKDEADFRKALDTIERNARMQTRLIEDLLDMNQITSGKIRLDIQTLDPITFIESALETVGPAMSAKGIRLVKLLDPGAGPITGDPNRLQQIIWNLLSNAIKFTARGGRVQVVLQRINSHIEITVADTGAGIHPEFLPHVFERFRQADPSTTRAQGGLGLGLAIVKSLVELHGGTVHVQSPGEGQGTSVTVHLPVTIVHGARSSAERLHPRTLSSAPVQFEHPDLSGVKVLVVDDDADGRDLISRVLEECNAEVLTAETAAQGLELLQQMKPHVLISDIGMPQMDGYEFLKKVRALGPSRGGKVPAIALTAFARSEDRTRALRAGFLVHVAKPVEPSELAATVASVTGRTETASASE